MYEVDEFVKKLNEPAFSIVQRLRHLIINVSPEIEESFKYNIPFYTYKGQLCYINPRKHFVDFGFTRGVELKDPSKLLMGDGQEVRLVRIESEEGIPVKELQDLISQSMVLNDTRPVAGN
jgi:hypothetical protein